MAIEKTELTDNLAYFSLFCYTNLVDPYGSP
jgi:hypothetical protein